MNWTSNIFVYITELLNNDRKNNQNSRFLHLCATLSPSGFSYQTSGHMECSCKCRLTPSLAALKIIQLLGV